MSFCDYLAGIRVYIYQPTALRNVMLAAYDSKCVRSCFSARRARYDFIFRFALDMMTPACNRRVFLNMHVLLPSVVAPIFKFLVSSLLFLY